MLEGTIVKGIGGIYYVNTKIGMYECKARGIFRKKNITPLVGDNVLIDENPSDHTGYMVEIRERKTKFERPPVANITQTVIVMSIKNPDINLWLLDRFLILAKYEKIKEIICITKNDLCVNKEEINLIKKIYNSAGYEVLGLSKFFDEGMDRLREILKDNITVFSGPSGVGKSSLLNKIQPDLSLQTGEISHKTKRGKHTTRHVELLELKGGGYVVDTPGFSTLNIEFIKNESDVQQYFNEIAENSGNCKFSDCLHYKEADCEVKRKVEDGVISRERYENYLRFLQEIKSNKRRY